MNVVMLIGNLATDVELREVGDGKQRATFLLAVDRPRGDVADFVGVVAWGEQAEACAALSKGGLVALDGRLRSRSWEESGRRRSAIEVVAHHLHFLSANAEAAAA